MGRLSHPLRLTVAALGLAAAPLFAQEEPEQGGFTFRSDVSLVNVVATVVNEKGVPIGGLDQENFRIVDGGEEQEITVFERRTDRPLSVMLLIDASLSTAIELKFEKNSAKRFASRFFGEGSHPDDRLGVMKFSEGVELLAPLTRSRSRVERGIDRLKAESGTSMYDGVLLAAEELERMNGRRVIILISDGGDTTSYTEFRTALETAHNADVVIYGLTVQPIKSDAGRNSGGEAALAMFARGTGGSTYIEYGEEALNRAFDEILDNLRTQYLLAYYPPEHTDRNTRYRRIEVTVDLPGATVLAREGYYVPKEQALLPESIPSSVQPAVQVEQPPRRWRKAPPEPDE